MKYFKFLSVLILTTSVFGFEQPCEFSSKQITKLDQSFSSLYVIEDQVIGIDLGKIYYGNNFNSFVSLKSKDEIFLKPFFYESKKYFLARSPDGFSLYELNISENDQLIITHLYSHKFAIRLENSAHIMSGLVDAYVSKEKVFLASNFQIYSGLLSEFVKGSNKLNLEASLNIPPSILNFDAPERFVKIVNVDKALHFFSIVKGSFQKPKLHLKKIPLSSERSFIDYSPKHSFVYSVSNNALTKDSSIPASLYISQKNQGDEILIYDSSDSKSLKLNFKPKIISYLGTRLLEGNAIYINHRNESFLSFKGKGCSLFLDEKITHALISPTSTPDQIILFGTTLQKNQSNVLKISLFKPSKRK